MNDKKHSPLRQRLSEVEHEIRNIEEELDRTDSMGLVLNNLKKQKLEKLRQEQLHLSKFVK